MIKENILRMKIESKQNWKNKVIHFDPDSSPEAWKHYRKYYSNLMSVNTNYNFQNLHFFNYSSSGYVDYPISYFERLYSLPNDCRHSSELEGYTYYSAVERLSGDTDFNFNEKKFNKYSKILFENCKNEKEFSECMKKLYKCSEMHHTLLNFSLMQTMGNLQTFKSKGLLIKKCKKSEYDKYEQLDRLDTFIYYLSEYYHSVKKSESQIGMYLENLNININNKKSLINYLDEFGSNDEGFETYYRNVYFGGIEEDNELNNEMKILVGRLVESGKKKVDSPKRIIEYMDLANQFWDIRENALKIKNAVNCDSQNCTISK